MAQIVTLVVTLVRKTQVHQRRTTILWRVNRLRGAKTIEEFRGSSQDRPSVVLPDYIIADRE